eukprot:12604398-Alexandrium_andersonii.AAC.1
MPATHRHQTNTAITTARRCRLCKQVAPHVRRSASSAKSEAALVYLLTGLQAEYVEQADQTQALRSLP